jgi:hypothetical protein
MQYGNRQNLNPRRNSAYDGPVAPARQAVRAPAQTLDLYHAHVPARVFAVAAAKEGAVIL